MQKVIVDGGTAYRCSDGEDVTVSYVAHNTDSRVTFQFENDGGPQNGGPDDFNFLMKKPKRILRVFFHFVNESGTGGSYDIELSGSEGGVFPDTPAVDQVFDEVLSRRYVFIL
jgi:hypothetical protein